MWNKSPRLWFRLGRRIQTLSDLLSSRRAESFYKSFRQVFQQGAFRESVMAKGQMRSNKEKKKPKADKNVKKGGATPSPFASGKPAAGQSPYKKS
jgi:hypothetical protein